MQLGPGLRAYGPKFGTGIEAKSQIVPPSRSQACQAASSMRVPTRGAARGDAAVVEQGEEEGQRISA